jgi:signal peptidase I
LSSANREGNELLNSRLWIRNNRGFLVFLLAFGLIRVAVADYNPVPSGSMHPNILEGDVVLVNRLAYNLKLPLTDLVLARLGDPKRGDIVTFSSPKDGVRLIKRVIGLPTDIVVMQNKRLLINGQPIAYAAMGTATEDLGKGDKLSALRVKEELGDHPYQVQWLARAGSVSNFGPIAIPADQYLMLGDNRDNSADSRFIGLVPRDLLIGRAERILVSAAITTDWMPRFERFGNSFYE